MAHCGGPLSGSFIHSLVATDISTGWTEAVPLLAREQSLVVAGLEAIGQRLPFPIRGIDSSAATLDRLLKPIRPTAGSRRKSASRVVW